MGQDISIPKDERLALTMCSYEKHFLASRPRAGDDDICDHPLCERAVARHWRSKAERLEKELEETKKKHEEATKRLLTRISSGSALTDIRNDPNTE
jgi:hypothetical protein